MNVTENRLKKLQAIEIGILQDVHDFCQTNGIKYYLLGGTLLGAVRHKGFIPWDDDIDIGMLREDYDRFIQLFQSHMPDKYYVQCFQNEREFWQPFAQVRLNGTRVDLVKSHNIQSHNGICIDIFPIDNAPKQKSVTQTIQAKMVEYLRSIKMVRVGIMKPASFKFRILLALFRPVSFETINRFTENIMRIHNTNKTDYCVNLGSYYSYKKQTMPISFYGQPVLINFENKMFYAPAQYEKVLGKIFGDYMQLPPENERVSPHCIENVYFGKYANDEKV